MLPYQRHWVEDDSKLKIVVKARQIGYSFAATLRAVMKCLEHKATWIFLSKGERQSRLLMEKVHDHIRSCGIVARTNESTFFEGTSLKQLEVRFPNGSVIYGLPANPDTARGYSGHVTLDEFAFHADAGKIYAALFPTITRGYGLEVISTPNGTQGKFYELAKAAGLTDAGVATRESDAPPSSPRRRGSSLDFRLRGNDKSFSESPIPGFESRAPAWSPHYCDVYDAVRQGLQVDINLLRNGCEDATAWQQEFCCQFVSTAENFFSPELLDACLSAEAGAGFQVSGARCQLAGLLPDARHPKPDTCFYLGMDIGRRHDRTVFWVDEIVWGTCHPERSEGSAVVQSEEPLRMLRSAQHDSFAVARLVHTMENAPFAEQLAYAQELLHLQNPDGELLIRRCSIDATGIGAHMAETLAREFGPRVEPVVFTAAVKEDLAFRTKRRMEARLSVLPDTPAIRRAFSAVKKFITPSGNLRFDAARTEAGHADEFWAKALADLAADPDAHRAAARAEDAFLADSLPIVHPGAFREVDLNWSEIGWN